MPFLIRLAPVDPRWILRCNLAEIFFYDSPKVLISPAAFCETALCVPTFDVKLEKKKDKNVTTTYVTTTFASNNLLASDLTTLEFISSVVVYSTESIRSAPPTLRTSFFEEVDKYSVSDTAIDSFAISGIIVSSILLFVTLAKLVLFFIFNPNSRKLL